MTDDKITWNFKTTEEIPVPERLIDQIIGQDKAVEIIKLAAKQRRHVLMIGSPGTGKSMMAQAMAELMPAEELEDVLVYPNPLDENNPKVKVVKTYPSREEIQKNPYWRAVVNRFPDPTMGMGRKIMLYEKQKEPISNIPQTQHKKTSPLLTVGIIALLTIIAVYITDALSSDTKWFILGFMFMLSFLYFLFSLTENLPLRMSMPNKSNAPKLIVDNSGRRTAPFVDATGAKAGALLGDVRHDPLQSGGLGTPAHLRVEAGAIHKANRGVLFIDEITSLTKHFQQELLTAMQEKKYPITGQSELSSGAVVKTDPVPCDFVLVAAGNPQDILTMHPALRSRIRGSGYEIYVEDHLPDTPENELKLVRFVAQEVKKDGKIPHFTKDAVKVVIETARRWSRRRNHFSLNLRELGGLVRAAGDLAVRDGAKYVEAEHVKRALNMAKTFEEQLSQKVIDLRKEYKVFMNRGEEIGRVNGLAVVGNTLSGIVLPIVAEVTPSFSKSGGRFIATGKLGEIAKEAIDNVSAIIKKHVSKDISHNDIHVQFLQTYEGVEGDSASIAVAVAVISAMENIPVDQSVGMTGSLTVRGDVLPVGGLTGKVEACIEAGLKKVIVPRTNLLDIHIPKERIKKSGLQVIPVDTIVDVLEHALVDTPKKRALLKRMAKGIKPIGQKKAEKKKSSKGRTRSAGKKKKK